MNLRPAVLADCLTLAAIDAQGNPSPWTAQQFESAVQHHPDSVWLSQTDHQITGFIVWQTVFDESELHLIAVAPEYRRQGIASALLQHWQTQCNSKAQPDCCSKSAQAMKPRNSSTANTASKPAATAKTTTLCPTVAAKMPY